MWYEWNTKKDFNTWHDNLCVELGYPLTPVNQLTGLPDEDAQKVVTYTDVVKVEDKWIAYVDDEYADGLTSTELRKPSLILEKQ
jgi:hypothetical protein